MGSHVLCVLMYLGIPLFHHDGQGYDHYVLHNAVGKGTIIFFLHNVVMTVTSSNGFWPKELPEYARPTRKVAQWCVN